MVSNKAIGTDFERWTCERLAHDGYWVHFIAPDARGAQPFDIVAAKDGRAVAIDCKTCVANSFNVNRLEDNQITAFELWLKRGNDMPMIYVKHKDELHIIPYDVVMREKSVNLKNGGYFVEYIEEDI